MAMLNPWSQQLQLPCLNNIRFFSVFIIATTMMIVELITANGGGRAAAADLCRESCSSGTAATSSSALEIKYPFGIDGGCGASQYKGMLNCNGTAGLFFVTPSGSYKVEAIDYRKRIVTISDPSMSTCSQLLPQIEQNFVLKSDVISPSHDTVLAILNCSVNSPLLNSQKKLCFTDLASASGGETCDKLCGTCDAFRIFEQGNTTPPCCYTTYATLEYMNMDMLDCTHYTSFYMMDGDGGAWPQPIDRHYGVKLSFGLPPDAAGCDRCTASGGTCGFDVDTLGPTCICSAAMNSTSLYCGSDVNAAVERKSDRASSFFGLLLLLITLIIFKA